MASMPHYMKLLLSLVFLGLVGPLSISFAEKAVNASEFSSPTYEVPHRVPRGFDTSAAEADMAARHLKAAKATTRKMSASEINTELLVEDLDVMISEVSKYSDPGK